MRTFGIELHTQNSFRWRHCGHLGSGPSAFQRAFERESQRAPLAWNADDRKKQPRKTGSPSSVGPPSSDPYEPEDYDSYSQVKADRSTGHLASRHGGSCGLTC